MPLNISQLKLAYQQGIKLYSGKIGITKAKEPLINEGVNSSTATDLIYNVKHLLNGNRFKRALSSNHADNFLKWIKEDYGTKGIRNALWAFRQNIEYRMEATGGNFPGPLEIYNRHLELSEEHDLEDFVVNPEELGVGALVEGKARTITINRYERSSKARKLCLQHYKAICVICKFDFKEAYGAIGDGFIHVHHLKEISTIGREYEVDPILDLRPVCPNCHAMIHQQTPAYTIDEIKKRIRQNKPLMPSGS